MKQYIDTAPVVEAFEVQDECPFCYLERMTRQRAIRYVAGDSASYMEPQIRAITDAEGFCGEHLKMLYDYGNPLGSALMMQTHLIELQKELTRQLPPVRPKRGEMPLIQWLRKRNHSCYLCQRTKETMDRYIATFFAMLKDDTFVAMAENSKGFCFRHFEALLEAAPKELPKKRQEWFYAVIPQLFLQNVQRVQGDLDWFIAKHDYRNAGADWRNSRDAVSRAMQKLQGGYPADPPYKKK